MNILVVDDDSEVAATLGILLKKLRHSVSTVSRGADALVRARDEAFDVVILDVRMPEMDGFTVLRELKAQRCTAGIVMLTGQGDVEEAVEASRLGADDYLPKPIRLAGLERVLASVAAARRSPPRTGGAP